MGKIRPKSRRSTRRSGTTTLGTLKPDKIWPKTGLKIKYSVKFKKMSAK
jgi:hypothetical protein